MARIFRPSWIPLFLLLLGLPAGAWAKEPAIVLPAFGTTTAAFDTYRHLEERVRERITIYLDHLQAAARTFNN
jgi:hypothetical protein